jgi:hypothetical protein
MLGKIDDSLDDLSDVGIPTTGPRNGPPLDDLHEPPLEDERREPVDDPALDDLGKLGPTGIRRPRKNLDSLNDPSQQGLPVRPGVGDGVMLNEGPVSVVPVGHPMLKVIRIDGRENRALISNGLGDPSPVPEHGPLNDPIGGDISKIGPGVEPGVQIDVPIHTVPQIGIHGPDVGSGQLRRNVVPQKRENLADTGGDPDLPVEPVAVVPGTLIPVVPLEKPGQPLDNSRSNSKIPVKAPQRRTSGKSQLVQHLERPIEVGVTGPQRHSGEQLPVPGAIQADQSRPSSPLDAGELPSNLTPRVGHRRPSEHGNDVVQNNPQLPRRSNSPGRPHNPSHPEKCPHPQHPPPGDLPHCASYCRTTVLSSCPQEITTSPLYVVENFQEVAQRE